MAARDQPNAWLSGLMKMPKVTQGSPLKKAAIVAKRTKRQDCRNSCAAVAGTAAGVEEIGLIPIQSNRGRGGVELDLPGRLAISNRDVRAVFGRSPSNRTPQPLGRARYQHRPSRKCPCVRRHPGFRHQQILRCP